MNRAGQRGASLFELMVTVAVMGLAMSLFFSFLSSSKDAMMTTEIKSDLSASAQRMTGNLRATLQQSSHLYCSGTSSDLSAMRALIEAGVGVSSAGGPAPAIATFTKPPYADDRARLTDVDSEHLGNILHLAVTCPPVKVKVSDTAGTMVEVLVDRFQYVVVYPTVEGANLDGLPGRLRLVEWRSVPYLSLSHFWDIALGASPMKLTKMAEALVAAGYAYAIDPADGSIRSIHNSYPVTRTAALAAFSPGSWAYLDEFQTSQTPFPNPLSPTGRVRRGGFFGGVSGFPSTYSVAYNSSTFTPEAFRVNRLYGSGQDLRVPEKAAASSINAFPGGFEAAFYGGGGKRELWVRVVLMAKAGNRPLALPKSYDSFQSLCLVSLNVPE